MLNRRHLRIKVLQALYAFTQSSNSNLASGEKELFHSIDRIYDLYIYYLLLFDEINRFARQSLEDGKKKRLPTPEDLNPNTRFVDNAIFNLLANNSELARVSQTSKVSWAGQQDLAQKLFREIKETEEFAEYMETSTGTFEEDRQFALKIFKKYMANFERIHELFEERSIYWNDDVDLMCSMVLKTIKQFTPESGVGAALLPLYKDPKDEIQFVKDLFRKTITNNEQLEEMIDVKTKNWEVERIASMDILLMKMAITEVLHFESIPVKVTLNEYIEISKFYSTPKSNIFINGILDKVFEELKEGGKIKKVGRGLIN